MIPITPDAFVTLMVGVLTVATGLVGIVLTHYFTKKRKIDELLFNARKEAYTEFIRNFGMAFGTETLDADIDEKKAIWTNYERMQRVSRIFAQCRLVANPLLEDKLRHLYDLVTEDFETKDGSREEGKRERDYIGYEVEALMRRDLKVIDGAEVMFWRLFSIIKRRNLRKKEIKKIVVDKK
jgi:hypothetical protein